VQKKRVCKKSSDPAAKKQNQTSQKMTAAMVRVQSCPRMILQGKKSRP
jgi:hypothetical protein